MNNIFADDNVTQTESVKNTYASSNETTQEEYKQFNKETESEVEEHEELKKFYIVKFIDKVNKSTKTIKVEENKKVKAIEVKNEQIRLKGDKIKIFSFWADKNGKEFDFNKKITKDITLYAKYYIYTIYEKNIVVRQVSFDARNGEKIKTSMIEKHKIREPKDPSKSGYRFLGWYTKPASGKKWDFKKDKSYNDITLYAHWEKITDSYYVSPKTGEDMPKYLYFFAAGCIGLLISAIKLKKQFD